ncbi:hypothetical protein [Dehalococcoides mccartyi]|uniref:Reductive dehalogenase anchoring protein n=1 Tax=Dehalococcoides mccartyi (strain VS) TaxID=311424 RepID=D2BG04_DEHMV|nr:hypothetical protein [Dehalococcoides mccartyi]ACZ61254.1 reductive dehalogenase anchoring protein [Dehalococcoides mccartyi VS]
MAGFFSFPWDWLITGIVVGAAVMWLQNWLSMKNLKLMWYHWIIGLIGLGFVLFGLQNLFAALKELEPRAALNFIWAIILPGILLLVLSWQLARAYNRKS